MADRTKRVTIAVSAMSFVLVCMAIGAATVLLHSSNSSLGTSAEMAGMPGMSMPTNMNMSGATMSALSCSLVSPGQLDAALNKLVQPPVAHSTKFETDCRYGIGSKTDAVDIKYTMKVSTGQFESLTTALAAANNRTRHFCGLGDSAYYTQVGAGRSTSTALVVLKGSNQVVIIAPGSVPQVEAIAQRVLPAL